MRPRMRERMGSGAAVLVNACVWAACAGEAPRDAGSEPGPGRETAVEFVYSTHGGLCATPDGGDLCSLRVVVRDDGTWSLTGTPARMPAGGVIPEGAATELAGVFEDGYEAMTARAFTEVCPVAYDGSEMAYEVRYLPVGPDARLEDAVVRDVRSCTFDLSHRRAQAAVAAIDDVWTRLGLPK